MRGVEQIGSGKLSLEKKIEDKEREEGTGNDSTVVKVYSGLFSGLFELNKLFLYSTSLETSIFHLVVRAFQKLAHSAGVLSLKDKLRACMKLFSILITNNVTSSNQYPFNDTSKSAKINIQEIYPHLVSRPVP